MINVVSQKWYGKAKRATDVYIGRPSLLGNPYAAKPSKYAQQSVSSDAEAVAQYRLWLREQYRTNPEIRAELLRLARLYQETGVLHLVCWCKLKVNDDTPCHGDVIREAIEGIIAKRLV
ncbi:MAG: hypothetical protein BroJett011_76120 [Chloroflexota bacterium]|nr:MAG: hypothetical protein BroJett011_76120 [Chloroflexota bacterium]